MSLVDPDEGITMLRSEGPSTLVRPWRTHLVTCGRRICVPLLGSLTVGLMAEDDIDADDDLYEDRACDCRQELALTFSSFVCTLAHNWPMFVMMVHITPWERLRTFVCCLAIENSHTSTTRCALGGKGLGTANHGLSLYVTGCTWLVADKFGCDV